ncbi:hypothetical protein LTR37_012672, partial [Vermiconidia calcicola]
MLSTNDTQGETFERSPLLPSFTDERSESPQPQPKTKPWQTTKNVTLLFMLVVLLVSLGGEWLDAPQVRILEAVICYRYYEKADPSKLLLDRDKVGPGAIGGVSEMF